MEPPASLPNMSSQRPARTGFPDPGPVARDGSSGRGTPRLTVVVGGRTDPAPATRAFRGKRPAASPSQSEGISAGGERSSERLDRNGRVIRYGDQAAYGLGDAASGHHSGRRLVTAMWQIPDPLDLGPFLTRRADAFRTEYTSRRLNFTILQEPAIHVRSDRAKLGSAVDILLRAAFDAMAGRADAIGMLLSNVCLTGNSERRMGPISYACIDVTDSGPGVSPTWLEATTRGRRPTTTAGRETGPDYARAAALLYEVGGELRIGSVPGEGVVSSIWIPTTVP